MIEINPWGVPIILLGVLGIFACIQAAKESEYNMPLVAFNAPLWAVIIGIGLLVTFPGVTRGLFA